MEFINNFFKFLIDTDHRFTKRFGFVVILSSFILILDNALCISEMYITSRQIEQISKIENLISNPTINYQTKVKLINLENIVLNKRDPWSRLSILGDSLKSKINKPKGIFLINENSNLIRSAFWHTITAATIPIILMIYLLFNLFTSRNPVGGTLLATTIVGEFFLLCITVFFSLILSYVPIIGSVWINYIINFLTHSLMSSLILYYIAGKPDAGSRLNAKALRIEKFKIFRKIIKYNNLKRSRKEKEKLYTK